MNHRSRNEIEKFANDAFALDRDRILTEYAEKKSRVLGQVKLTGNSGGYLPALVTWAAEREREMALARADAWVRAFTIFGVPSDVQAEEAIKTYARLSAAGSISSIRGELQLRAGRLGIAEQGRGMPWHLEIERSLNAALKTGELRLRQQRIMSNNSESLKRSPAVNRASGAETVASMRPLGGNSSRGVAEGAVTGLPELAGTQELANKERTSAMVVFGSSRPVTIVRGAGTPEELRWETRMGGDFDTKALFQSSDRVVTGDELHCDVFDQPRLVLRVKAVLANGEVAYWEAPIIPVSEWSRFQERNQNRNMTDARKDAYPKPMYHATKPPVMVYSAQQQAELGPDWSEKYSYQPYPKMKYHWRKDPVTVKDEKEDRGLERGWANNPSAFAWDNFKDRSWTQLESDPLRWSDGWLGSDLNSHVRNLIRAQLLKAHSAFLALSPAEGVLPSVGLNFSGTFGAPPAIPTAYQEAMKRAFGGVAHVLHTERILKTNHLNIEIPVLLSDTAVSAGWWPWPTSEARTDIYTEQFGHYWFWGGWNQAQVLERIFQAATTEWLGTLLEAPPAPVYQRRQMVSEDDKTRETKRRNLKYARIDSTLKAIAGAQPIDHEEVFKTLDSRRVKFADAEPFRSAGGWIAGFEKNPAVAHSWLSKRWAALGLPPFSRGPKK